MKLGLLARSSEWLFGSMLEERELENQALLAARHYAGWGRIASIDGPVVFENPTTPLFTPRTIPYLGPSDFPGVISAGYGAPFYDRPPVVIPPSPPVVPDVPPVLDINTDITLSEWAAIKPLCALYIERENARALEASRNTGVDVFGRAVSEVQADIERYESGDMPRIAFFQPVETI